MADYGELVKLHWSARKDRCHSKVEEYQCRPEYSHTPGVQTLFKDH